MDKKSEDEVRQAYSRRDFLRLSGQAALFLPLSMLVGCNACGGAGSAVAASSAIQPTTPFVGTDTQLLEDLQRTAYQFFWDQGYPATGLIKDRTHANDTDTYFGCSIAAVGFGLAALCIGDARGYGTASDIQARIVTTLTTLLYNADQNEGFFYHFLDWTNGKRIWSSELSSIDTAILICGILTARQYYSGNSQIVELATELYDNVNWQWMLNGGTALSMGWKPESGFLSARWTRYCELMMLYLLAIGSNTYPISPDTWDSWTRPTYTYQGITYISGGDPLFTHQYSHAFFDFRNKHDAYADYFRNSVSATAAHKQFCLSLTGKFPDYADNFWGITASDSINGYVAWGGPPAKGPIDGTVVPCAAAGSLPFAYDDCIKVLRQMRAYPRAWSRYGFVDAFNPLKGYFNADVLGIDLGVSMLMAENYRTQFVWNYFMKNPETIRAMQLAGFQPNGAAAAAAAAGQR
ncbi:MAG TPA: glucoamylase family protein [Candidatus Koribacter sp.]|jgi:hypothetical protein